MTVVVDAAPVVSIATLDHPLALQTLAFLESTDERLVMPAPVTAEIDFLLRSRIGPDGNLPFLRDLAAGLFEVACLDQSEYGLIAGMNERYREISAGLADLAVVALAARYNTTRVLTFDQRHFRTLLPFDRTRPRVSPLPPTCYPHNVQPVTRVMVIDAPRQSRGVGILRG